MKQLIVISLIALLSCSDLGLPPVTQQSGAIILATPRDFDCEKWPVGNYSIQSSSLEGDLLKLSITCFGSLPRHFELIAWNYWLESNPVQVYAVLSFRSENPTAGSTKYDLTFDLSPMKEQWRHCYGQQTGTIAFGIWCKESRPRLAVWYDF